MDLRTRRLIGLAPIVLAVGYTAFSLGGGCLAWEYEVASNAPETAPNDTTSADGPYVFPDGRECSGHDEDNDGVPDDCDNCPNVANPSQSGSSVGNACLPGNAFIPSPTRLLFDPFRSLGTWKAYGTGSGVFDLGSDSDSLTGGNASDSDCQMLDGGATGLCALHFLAGSTGAGASAVVVTTTMKVLEENADGGSAGLLLRVNGADMAKKAYLCAVSVRNGFTIARIPDTGCNGGFCGPVAFTMPGPDASVVPAQIAIPSDVPHGLGDVIGLRASVTASMGDGGTLGDIECRVFDPKRPETLTSNDSKYAIRVTAGGTRWFSSGEVGVYAQQARASFGSIDVLRGP